MKKNRGRIRLGLGSFYAKLVVVFLAIGLAPLLLMGVLIYQAYAGTLSKNTLSNYVQTVSLMSKNISDFVSELSDMTEYVYNEKISDYDYFYELIEDEELSETGKNALVTRVLRTILYMNDAIDHVMFLTPDGETFSVMRPPELLIDSRQMREWYDSFFLPESRAISIIPTHETRYFRNSDLYDFTLYRNIMNTSTIQKAGSEVLGTLFIDVRADSLPRMLEQETYGETHEICLADTRTGAYLYHPLADYAQKNARTDGIYLDEMKENGQGYLQTDGNYLIYSMVEGTDWMIVDRMDERTVVGSYRLIRNTTFILMGFGVCLLLLLYVRYSAKLNRPVTELKEAMGRIETGDLDVRVQIHSKDEFEDIGKGLNQMVENLSSYIQKAYMAEIRQRDAELETLKTQIQPHYLYNTLDVIRMSAITSDDRVVADMIDSLSAQLKYLIGTAGQMVFLEEEITCIRNYFRLIRVRYEQRFSLEIDVPERLMRCRVPHLIVQPIVENAVKHGLRPKKGPGEVVVRAKETGNRLELTVMDNGVGMSQERLEEIRESLSGTGRAEKEMRGMSIGIKNVSDRIHYLYGEEYGLEIDACEDVGMLVKYWLPLIWEEEEEDVSDCDRRR